ncbi:uncharacterized protein VDAG_03423 [Verticillium dahliae VdLs.17]|uniref:Extracellular membrane protein CFEM domain-containing protein n=1 Tax=Verticillium dahliae (strain VdLs.17 / ATCC MYA-4575 / FGSC 10137) TaxID=498257 RepID=G2WZI1_VERDV|nr:uncharacterized protein VDAG_03423 [Verticillium dahliae VdLs.17]EGY21983.1 hypothetical protein VDAG_03423 [Verticillium dahliae VdLs.17]
MRSILSTNAFLALLSLAGSAAAVLPTISECVHGKGAALAELASCGHEGSLAYCFTSLPAFFEASDLESCLVNAGCTPAEAAIEALWTLKRCERAAGHSKSGEADSNKVADLRRRSPQAAATPATTPRRARPAGAQLSCFPTGVLKAKCADDMWCAKKPGHCKVLNNKLDTSGVIVAILFSGAIVFAALGMCVLCWRDSKRQKGIRARAEAAALAAREREKKRAAVDEAMGAPRDGGDGGVKAPLIQSYEEDPFREHQHY